MPGGAGDDKVCALAGPAAGRRHFTTGTVYLTPDGGALELGTPGTSGGIRFFRRPTGPGGRPHERGRGRAAPPDRRALAATPPGTPRPDKPSRNRRP